MKLVQSPEEIPELLKSNVHIKNKEELIQKVNKLIKDGHKNLQIVTDFDHTLTRHTMDDGSMVLTSFGKQTFKQYISDRNCWFSSEQFCGSTHHYRLRS